jgi:hypothetical protein
MAESTLRYLPKIGRIFHFPFAGFQENAILTWRKRAFIVDLYNSRSLQDRCNIGFKRA